jgi:hypothetical protein
VRKLERIDKQMLKVAFKIKIKYSKLLARAAAENNHFEILKLIVAKNPKALTSRIATLAAQHSNIGMMEWLFKNKCRISLWATSNAIRFNQFETLVWLHKNGASLAANDANAIAVYGTPQMMEYILNIIQTNQPDQPDQTNQTTKHAIQTTHLTSYAVENKDLSMIIWLYNQGHQLDDFAIEMAVTNKNSKMIEWLFDHDCPVPQTICDTAIQSGSIQIVEYLLEKGFVISPNAYKLAVASNKIECIQWLYANGYKIPSGVIELASSYRFTEITINPDGTECNYINLEIIQWLYNHGEPLVEKALDNAIEGSNIKLIEWLIENNCPRSNNYITRAVRTCDSQTVEFLLDQHRTPPTVEEFDILMQRSLICHRFETVKTLYRRGAKLPQDDVQHYIIQSKQFQFVEWFLRHNCSLEPHDAKLYSKWLIRPTKKPNYNHEH